MTKKIAAAAPAEIPTPSIPKDLEAQMATIAAFGQTHLLLNKGHFPTTLFQAVIDSVGYMKDCFEKSVENALKHPQADLVPQLKELKEKASKAPKNEAQDGKEV